MDSWELEEKKMGVVKLSGHQDMLRSPRTSLCSLAAAAAFHFTALSGICEHLPWTGSSEAALRLRADLN